MDEANDAGGWTQGDRQRLRPNSYFAHAMAKDD